MPSACGNTSSSGGRRPTATPRSSTTAHSTSWSSGAARPESRAQGRSPSSTGASSSRTTRTCRRSGARVVLVEAGPEIFTMFKAKLRRYALKALDKFGVEVMVGEVVKSVAPTPGHARVGDGRSPPTRSCGARGCTQTRCPRHSESSSSGADGSRPGPISASKVTPRSSRWATSPGSRPARSRRSPSSAASRCSPASARARTSRVCSTARRPSRSTTSTRARWRRSAARRRSCRGRTVSR